MKTALLLRALHRRELGLARHLTVVSERHKADHELYHVARDLAAWSHEHARALRAEAPRHDTRLRDGRAAGAAWAAVLRERAGELAGRMPGAELLLLRDLRAVYLDASGISLDWEMLGQLAQATRDGELLALVGRCHPETLRQVRWANAKLKEVSPQALAG